MSEVLESRIEATGPETTVRVPAHRIDLDWACPASETFRKIPRAPFEAVRMEYDRALQANNQLVDYPYVGESVDLYRRRLATALMPHAVTYPAMKLEKINGKLFRDIEQTVLKEAIEKPARDGRLVEIKLKDRSGRAYSEYEGSMGCWLNQFKGPVMASPILVPGGARRSPPMA
ncbi:hypothetical protein VSR68_03320 [Paraburkholderia phymatum]|uniref:hypothetical protein n=1 Tax=Paraburkholderia phymatum TaxID=148447 RepID=UPI003176B2BA